MQIVGQRVCGTCKHFFLTKGMANAECRFWPPKTTPFIIRIDPMKGPIVHNVIGYDLVSAEFYCAQWAPKIEIPNGASTN